MKFTLSWLKEFLDTDLSGIKIYETLNKIGLEVDEYIDYSEKYKNLYCVEIENVEKHPDSDHLHICKVKDKNLNIITIVCGAPNVKNGLKTILCPINTKLPNGVEIKKTKIRGIESFGMMCSAKELGIGDEHDGIIELKSTVQIGTTVAEIFNLNDVFFDIAITPNKGDCLGIYGIARELSSAGIGRLKNPEIKQLNSTFKSKVDLKVNDKNCYVFSFREIKNLKNCESPKWLKDRLNSIGLNPRNALVDIGNYIMYCYNTPLHCYDADKVNNEIILYPSKQNEEFISLFNEKFLLNEDAIVIADKDKKLCLAGILGSNTSGSEITTTRVLVECAIFDPISIAKTGRILNIQSDARFRFEREIDYNSIEIGLNYACQLILEICGGEISNVVKYEQLEYKNKIIRKINLNLKDVEKLIGLKIENNTILNILNLLGYKIEQNKDELILTIPTWKNSILIKEDLIDDIIRFYGYDNLNDNNFSNVDRFESKHHFLNKNKNNILFNVRKKLTINGLTEIVSYAFLNKKNSSLFQETNDNLELLNPIISDLSYMRQNILTNLLTIIEKNNNRDFLDLSFFELGNIFTTNDINKEKLVLGGVRSGNYKKKNIYNDNRKFDVFDVKKDLFNILEIFGINSEKLNIIRDIPKYYHPNKSAAIFMGNILLGYFGEIHPNIIKELKIQNNVFAFELFLNNLPESLFLDKNEKKSFKVNDLQAIERSFSFIINKDLEVGNILKDLMNLNKEFIANVILFDIYHDEKKSDQKSIAFKIIIQPKEKSLTKEEIDNISDNVIELIGNKYSGILRDGK